MAANLELVRIILFTPDKRTLVTQRPLHVRNSPGMWSLIGGKTDGLPVDVAAIKEIREEGSIEVEQLNYVCYRKREYQMQVWGMTYFSKELHPGQEQQIRDGFNRHEILGVDFLQRASDVDEREFAFGDNVVLRWFMVKILGRL